jgi:hypothetical protein
MSSSAQATGRPPSPLCQHAIHHDSLPSGPTGLNPVRATSTRPHVKISTTRGGSRPLALPSATTARTRSAAMRSHEASSSETTTCENFLYCYQGWTQHADRRAGEGVRSDRAGQHVDGRSLSHRHQQFVESGTRGETVRPPVAAASRPTRRNHRRGTVSDVRRLQLHHRLDPAGRRRPALTFLREIDLRVVNPPEPQPWCRSRRLAVFSRPRSRAAPVTA